MTLMWWNWSSTSCGQLSFFIPYCHASLVRPSLDSSKSMTWIDDFHSFRFSFSSQKVPNIFDQKKRKYTRKIGIWCFPLIMLYAVVHNAANCPPILIRRSLLFFLFILAFQRRVSECLPCKLLQNSRGQPRVRYIIRTVISLHAGNCRLIILNRTFNCSFFKTHFPGR